MKLNRKIIKLFCALSTVFVRIEARTSISFQRVLTQPLFETGFYGTRRLKSRHKANKYTSSEIQNDILKVMAVHILRDIVEEKRISQCLLCLWYPQCLPCLWCPYSVCCVHSVCSVCGVHSVCSVCGVHSVCFVCGVHSVCFVCGVHSVCFVCGVHSVCCLWCPQCLLCLW